jgi:penicillin-binding protein 2
MRIKAVYIFLSLIFLSLVLWLFNLQIIRGNSLRDSSEKNCIRLIAQPGARGLILDRQGEVIVGNALTYDLMVLPQGNDRLSKTLAAAAKILGVDAQDLRKTYKKNYVALFMPVAIVNNLELKKAIALEELKMDFPEIFIQAHPLRDYPYGDMGCHLIGYLNEIDHWRLTKLNDYGYKNKDIVGYSGVEEKYDYYLREEDGALSVEVDHRGRFTRVLGYRPAQSGKDIQLTIDLGIEKIAHECLGDRKGSVIMMNPYTGEIICLVSSPGFSPEVFIKKNNSMIARLFSDPNKAMINRAISGTYPLGSVFKPVVASAALEMKKINQSTSYVCSGGMNVGRRRFNCWDTHNRQDLLGAIARSCDVFFYHTGLLLGAQAIHDYALKFGYGRLTEIDLPYEVAGFVPDPLWKKISRMQTWYDGDTANFSIGQGDLLVTPIQALRMMGVFASEGLLVRPYVVKNIDGEDVFQYQRKIAKVNLQKKNIDIVREGLRKVVTEEDGTANMLSSLAVEVAGKTGTAQAARGASHGWFAGFFPFNNPKYAVLVFLENGGSGHAAAALARQIIEKMSEEKLL